MTGRACPEDQRPRAPPALGPERPLGLQGRAGGTGGGLAKRAARSELARETSAKGGAGAVAGGGAATAASSPVGFLPSSPSPPPSLPPV